MNVLAFDTCFGAVSAAVRWRSVRGEWLLREAYEPLTTGHAERLLPVITSVMDGAGLLFNQLDRIAVTIGPGGFTGLRAGVAAARALALALDRPVVGLSSLAVIAARADLLLGERRGGRPMVVAVDARRGALFVQVFAAADALLLSAPQAVTPAEAVALLPPGPVIVVGSGGAALMAAAMATERAQPALAQSALAQSALAQPALECLLPDVQPHARQLVQLATVLSPLDHVSPLYLRAADAKPPADPSIARRVG